MIERWKTTKSETSARGIDVPKEMEGGLNTKDTRKKCKEVIAAEIFCRRIKLPVNEDGRREKCNQLNTEEKRDI